jgi:hypothetical protein
MSDEDRAWAFEFEEIIGQQEFGDLPTHQELMNEAKLGAARQLLVQVMHMIVETAPGTYTYAQAWFGALGIIEGMAHAEVHAHLDDD